MYIMNMIHFLMILDDFGVFCLNVNGRTNGRNHGRTDPFIEDASKKRNTCHDSIRSSRNRCRNSWETSHNHGFTVLLPMSRDHLIKPRRYITARLCHFATNISWSHAGLKLRDVSVFHVFCLYSDKFPEQKSCFVALLKVQKAKLGTKIERKKVLDWKENCLVDTLHYRFVMKWNEMKDIYCTIANTMHKGTIWIYNEINPFPPCSL